MTRAADAFAALAAPVAPSLRTVQCTVNGDSVAFGVAPFRTLLDALRHELDLTGTKKGCDVGECGSCTVIMNGEPVNACLVLAVEAEGARITTVEGLQAADGTPHPLQDCFMQCGAAQCGFCTPGILVAAKALLDRNPAPTTDEIRFAIACNIYLCTGYSKVIDAIALAATAQEASA